MRGGITPAHAGKSIKSSRFFASCWDHPRTRGEKIISLLALVHRLGSPPHTRGKVGKGTEMIGDDRITPAHAGKRFCTGFSLVVLRDHPRTRGEKRPTPP